MPSRDPRPLDVALATAREAGALVEAMRARGVSARAKDDASPVTEADEAADLLIRTRLMAAGRDPGRHPAGRRGCLHRRH